VAPVRPKVYRGTDGEAGSQLERIVAETLPLVYLARHGETTWSVSGQHTGRTDLPLTESGQRNGCTLGARLRGLVFARIFTSPLQHAADLRAGRFWRFSRARSQSDGMGLRPTEGRRTAEILAKRPDWQLFRDGCPGGESPTEIGARADRLVGRVRAIQGDVLLFSGGHFLRVLAARWLGLEPAGGRYFLLGTTACCVLGYEHNLSEPAIRLWNDTHHLDKA